MTRLAAALAVAVVVAGCGPTPPRDLDEAIRLGRVRLAIEPAVEVLRRFQDDVVLVVFFGEGGVREGTAILVLDREAPWTIRDQGLGTSNLSDPAWVHLSWTGDPEGFRTTAYGPVRDIRIRAVEIDFPSGPVRLEAQAPAFAAVIESTDESLLTWRFLDAAGNPVLAPFDGAP